MSVKFWWFYWFVEYFFEEIFLCNCVWVFCILMYFLRLIEISKGMRFIKIDFSKIIFFFLVLVYVNCV